MLVNIGWDGLKNRTKWFRKENVGKESKRRCSAKEQKWKYSSWRVNKIRDEKQAVAQMETKCLGNMESWHWQKGMRAPRERKENLMITDSDIVLVDYEKEEMGWKKDWKKVRSKLEEERSETNLYSASPAQVMVRAGQRCLWHYLKTTTNFPPALGFPLPPASLLRRNSFWTCLTGERRTMQGDTERENSYLREHTAWERNIVSA